MTVQKYMRAKADGSGFVEHGTTVETSAGAADASKIPNTNANGVLDPTLLNATVTSSGAASANKPILLDPTGRIDLSAMPVGIGPEVSTVQTSEALAAGDFVQEYDTGAPAGTQRVRKADASNGRAATGFVIASFASGVPATVYHDGNNTQVSGKTFGKMQFLSATTPGQCTETAPTTTGQLVQPLGYALSPTSINWNPGFQFTA